MLTETDTTILQESLPFWDQLNGNQKELLKSGSSLMKYAYFLYQLYLQIQDW